MVKGGEGGGATRYARPCRPVKPLLTTWLASAMSVAQVTQRRVLGCARVKPRGSSSSSVTNRILVPYSGILERAARRNDFADVGEDGRMKCAEGGEEEGVVDGEEVGELDSEGGG